MSNAKRHRFPLVVKRGSCAVKIYRDRKAAGTYYRVVYYLGGKRQRLNFSNPGDAINEAEAKASQLSRGDIDAAQLSGRDRLVYGRALDAIRDQGRPLDAVAIEYADACKILHGASLLDAARFYRQHHFTGLKRKSVEDGKQEMIAAKTADRLSDVYLNDLRYRLGTFADAFHCDFVSLSADDVRGFFDRLKLSPRSFNNFVSALRTFFRFAQDRGWLAKEADLLRGIRPRKGKSRPVEILSPDEIAALMQHAPDEIAPCLALGAFAGLRSQEILRLEWTDVTRRTHFIEIAAHKAKTATRRLVPISDNLRRWLAISPTTDGLVWADTKAMFYKIRLNLAAQAGVDWRQNCLRHSWISYRLAETQDVNRVALEAGNSPQMIFRHYRELATPDQAKGWFSIAPKTAENVVPIRYHA